MLKKYQFDRGTIIKGSLAIIVLIGAVVYAVHTFKAYNSGLPPERTVTSAESYEESPDGTDTSVVKPGTNSVQMMPISEEERKEIREEFIRELDLTPEQVRVAKEYEKKGPPKDLEEVKARMEVMRETLTPEQQQKFWEKMREVREERIASRMEKAKQTLPPDQFEIFEERLDERLNQFQQAIGERRGDVLKRNLPDENPIK